MELKAMIESVLFANTMGTNLPVGFDDVLKRRAGELFFLTPVGKFSCFLCRLLIFFFQINFCEKLFQCQTDWIQIRHYVLSCLFSVQTVYKSYQQAGELFF